MSVGVLLPTIRAGFSWIHIDTKYPLRNARIYELSKRF